MNDTIIIPRTVGRTALSALQLMGECFLKAQAQLPEHEGPRVRNVLSEQLSQCVGHAVCVQKALDAPSVPPPPPDWVPAAKAHCLAISDLVDSAQKTLSVEDYNDSLVGAARRLEQLMKLLEGGALP